MNKKGNPNIGKLGRRTQFGQPNAPDCHRGGKTIRHWMAELVRLTEKELEAFVENKKSPEFIRKIAILIKNIDSISDAIRIIDAVESKPKEIVEVEQKPFNIDDYKDILL